MDEVQKYKSPKTKKNQYTLIDSPGEKKTLLFLGCLFFTACALIFLLIEGFLGYLLFITTIIFVSQYYVLLIFPKSSYTKIGKEGIITKSQWTFFQELIIPWRKISFFYLDEKGIFIRIKFEEGAQINLFERYFGLPFTKYLQDTLNNSLEKYKK